MPPKMPPTVVTYVRLSAASVKQIDRIARHDEMSRSNVIRSLLLKVLREMEQNESQQRAA